jgi:hypothetical protein
VTWEELEEVQFNEGSIFNIRLQSKSVRV